MTANRVKNLATHACRLSLSVKENTSPADGVYEWIWYCAQKEGGWPLPWRITSPRACYAKLTT